MEKESIRTVMKGICKYRKNADIKLFYVGDLAQYFPNITKEGIKYHLDRLEANKYIKRVKMIGHIPLYDVTGKLLIN